MGDRGTVVNVVSWMLLAISICTLIARFAMKFSIKNKSRRFGLDDTFIACAAVSDLTERLVPRHSQKKNSFSALAKLWQCP